MIVLCAFRKQQYKDPFNSDCNSIFCLKVGFDFLLKLVVLDFVPRGRFGLKRQRESGPSQEFLHATCLEGLTLGLFGGRLFFLRAVHQNLLVAVVASI